MPLARVLAPFDSPDWLFELKYDGFRALAYINGNVKLVSRRGHVYKSFPRLCSALAEHIRVDSAVLDGEIVCLDSAGRSQFKQLLFRRGNPCFAAFDLLWLNGEDMRGLALTERKRRLKRILSRKKVSPVLYVNHILGGGTKLFEAVCAADLEGIVAKPKRSTYHFTPEQTCWLKIKNANYSQVEGRNELFEARS